MHYILHLRCSTRESDSHFRRLMRLSWSNLLVGSARIKIVEFNWFKRWTCHAPNQIFDSAHGKYDVWTGPNFPYLFSQHLRRRFLAFWIPVLEVRSMKIIINVVTWNYSPKKVNIARVRRDASGWATGRHTFSHTPSAYGPSYERRP